MISIPRPGAGEHSDFHAGYIGRAPDLVDAERQIREQAAAVADLFRRVPAGREDFAYAAGKWTVRQMLGHFCDTERILSYRLLRVARADETPLAGFEEDDYVRAAAFERRPLPELIDEWLAVRGATASLFRSVPVDAWARRGVANGNPISARALAYIIAGHVEHHRHVLAERYGVS